MSAETPTPRVDAAWFNGRDMGNDGATPHFPCVDADFARQLERENAELIGKLEGLERDVLFLEDNSFGQGGGDGADFVCKWRTPLDSECFRDQLRAARIVADAKEADQLRAILNEGKKS